MVFNNLEINRELLNIGPRSNSLDSKCLSWEVILGTNNIHKALKSKHNSKIKF